MFGRNAASECFNDIELTLPNGREVVGKVPTLKRAYYFMDLLHRSSNGDQKATTKLLDEFPREVELEEELNQIRLQEFYDVVNRFFVRRGSGNGASPEQTETVSEEMPAQESRT